MRRTCRASAWISTDKVLIKIREYETEKEICCHERLCIFTFSSLFCHSFLTDLKDRQKRVEHLTLNRLSRFSRTSTCFYLMVGCFWYFDIKRAGQDCIPAGAYVSLSKHCRQENVLFKSEHFDLQGENEIYIVIRTTVNIDIQQDYVHNPICGENVHNVLQSM